MKRPLPPRKARITAEMVGLYQRGCELRDSGASEDWEEHGGGRAEYLKIAKHLDWTLLKRAPHEVSVLEDGLEGPKPDYMAARDSERHPDFNGWYSARDITRQLREALDRSG
jgi:hypothetical protein